ncbi:MAG TPA: DUF1801 domain-containing protein [Ferruginibacter sp.]|nr:DUF1801 domain-containing protein [Chitinophagaceae bacterium]HQW93922.1 DUF1801 domain-containing protein [Ferruginibacter sp.]
MPGNVDAYLFTLTDPQQIIANRLRLLLFELVPEIQEKLSFNIPFYHYFGMFCYINAIPDGIDLGFCRGKDLVEEFPHLESRNRAIVASVTLYSLTDIYEKEVRAMIVAAALWNEEAKKKKIPMVKKMKPLKESSR